MININIIGAGAYGSKIVQKYKKFSDVSIKSIISNKKSKSSQFLKISFVASANEWKQKFKTPKKNDIFDICVHQNILIKILKDFVKIGAKNFILPKPIALSKRELQEIQSLAIRNKLKIAVSSQWYYSDILNKIREFIKKNRNEISSVNIVFSRDFDLDRQRKYNSKTAFLPHIIQILNDLNLINRKSKSVIENISDTKIKIRYYGKYIITAESDLSPRDKNKAEHLKIYLKDTDNPALYADFSGILGHDGFVKYPSVKIFGKENEIKEDVLEKMIEHNIKYFNSSLSKDTLTLDRYLPVANEIINIAESSLSRVAVIGGGIFGVMSALEISKKGYYVTIFEKESEIIKGASLVNQCRVHMGYHYPRDEKTAKDSLNARGPFEKQFGSKVVRKINNYYMVAKEGSFTNPNNFLKFCKKINLPYKISWPIGFEMHKEKISLSVNVPEKIFDANRKRNFLNKQIEASSNISLLKSAKVINLKQKDEDFQVEYEIGDIKKTENFGAIVNATYSATNYINNFLNLPLDTYQYELCEVPVVRTPWSGSGWSVIDGPFFGVMPFGFSKDYLFYDVELSVLDRVIGKFPEFKNTISYYDDEKKKKERFNKYKNKWGKWLKGLDECKHISSMYVTRIVLPNKDKTDTRPTTLNNLLPGYWQVFSGKIANSVPASIELSNEIDKFFKNKYPRIL